MADIILKNKVYENIDTVFLPSNGGNMVRFSEGSGGDAMPTPSFTLEEGTPDADGLSRSGLVRTTGLSYMEGGIDAGGIAGLVSTMLDMFGGSGSESALTELSENAPKLINNTVITKLKDVLKECAAVGIHYPKYTVHIRLTVDALQSLYDALPIAGLDAHNLDKQVEAIGKLWGYEKVTDLQPMIDDIQSALDDPETSEEDKKDMTAQKNFYEWLIDTVDSLIAAAKELLADDGVEVINVLLPEFQTSWAGLVNTVLPKFALDDMTSGSIKLFDRSFTQEELSAATITAVFGHGIKADHILALSHFYRLGDFSMAYPEVIGEEVTGTFDLEHRLVMLSADKNGMFRAFEQAIEKAPTPVIQLHMGATNEMLTLKNDQSGYTDMIISDGAVLLGNFADLSGVPGGKHSVQQRLYGDNIALSDASNAVEVTTAAITSLSANWTLTGNVKTAVAPAAITDDDEQPGEHRVVMNDDGTCTIVEPTAACQCKFAKKAESTSESGSTTDSSVSTTATTEPGNQEDAETVVYPDAGSVLVLRGSYSFVDFLNPNEDGSGMPSGDLYENYTYDAATGTFTFPDLCEDVYIFVKGE